MQKMLKKASKKLVFKRGIVHHKVGSPYLNNISNMNYTGHAKKCHPYLQSMRGRGLPANLPS
jgi:hypothetical protein